MDYSRSNEYLSFVKTYVNTTNDFLNDTFGKEERFFDCVPLEYKDYENAYRTTKNVALEMNLFWNAQIPLPEIIDDSMLGTCNAFVYLSDKLSHFVKTNRNFNQAKRLFDVESDNLFSELDSTNSAFYAIQNPEDKEQTAYLYKNSLNISALRLELSKYEKKDRFYNKMSSSRYMREFVEDIKGSGYQVDAYSEGTFNNALITTLENAADRGERINFQHVFEEVAEGVRKDSNLDISDMGNSFNERLGRVKQWTEELQDVLRGIRQKGALINQATFRVDDIIEHGTLEDKLYRRKVFEKNSAPYISMDDMVMVKPLDVQELKTGNGYMRINRDIGFWKEYEENNEVLAKKELKEGFNYTLRDWAVVLDKDAGDIIANLEGVINLDNPNLSNNTGDNNFTGFGDDADDVVDNDYDDDYGDDDGDEKEDENYENGENFESKYGKSPDEVKKEAIEYIREAMLFSEMSDKYLNIVLEDARMDEKTLQNIERKDDLGADDAGILSNFIDTFRSDIYPKLDFFKGITYPENEETEDTFTETICNAHSSLEKFKVISAMAKSWERQQQSDSESVKSIEGDIAYHLIVVTVEANQEVDDILKDLDFPNVDAFMFSLELREAVIKNHVLPLYLDKEYERSEYVKDISNIKGFQDLGNNDQRVVIEVANLYARKIVPVHQENVNGFDGFSQEMKDYIEEHDKYSMVCFYREDNIECVNEELKVERGYHDEYSSFKKTEKKIFPKLALNSQIIAMRGGMCRN